MKNTNLQSLRCARFILLGAAFVMVCAGLVAAQAGSPKPRPSPPPTDGGWPEKKNDDPPLTTFEEEIRAKRAIKMAEKEHQENVNRACEIAEIAKDIQTRLKDKSTIDRDSLKKIERLEKLTKKIRGEAGGEDQEVNIVDRPPDITTAVSKIADSAESLSKSVQNTPRQVISASLISNANVLLELIRVLRAFDPRP